MLDVYFAMRFLQLRDGVPDDPSDRSTDSMLRKLLDAGSLARGDYEPLFEGYQFLSRLDHAIRLIVGRTTRVPLANREAIRQIATRMNTASSDDLLERLTFHRLNIRAALDNVLAPQL
jgi:glutamine synthetase adenylyltransferase